jgi:DNA-binding response OmpR family regulator
MIEKLDILLFSESKELKNQFNSYLAQGDYFFHFARKDESGLNMLANKSYDLVIYEIEQPLFSEVSFIEQIHSLNNSSPIVIVSEFFGETRNTVFGNKISNYVSKPFTVGKLVDSINTVRNQQLNPDTDGKGLEIESKRLSILYEMSKSLNSITDFNLLLKTIIRLATDALNAERATLFIYDRTKNELWSRVGTGLELHEIRFPLSKGIAGKVVSQGYSILTDNPYNHPDFNNEFDKTSGFITHNLICVPMKNLNGIMVGAFQVLNKKEGIFTEQDELFLSAMAATTAIAIENTLLNEENKVRYNEILKLYDDLDTVQNIIVKDTILHTISEIREFITHIRQQENILNSIKFYKDNYATTESLDSINKIEQSYNNIFLRIGSYMNYLVNNYVKPR